MRSGCRGFESRSGHLIFSSICSVYIDRHIRVDLSDDEQYVRNMPCYIKLNELRIFLYKEVCQKLVNTGRHFQRLKKENLLSECLITVERRAKGLAKYVRYNEVLL